MMEPTIKTDKYELYLGDCELILPHLEPVDLLLTDPPYEITATGGGMGAKRQYLTNIKSSDLDIGFDWSLLKMYENGFCFCSKDQLPEMLSRVKDGRWMLITWNKTNPTPLTNNNYLPDTEYIVHWFTKGRLFGEYRDKSRFIVHPVEKNNIAHPTVKPVSIMTKLVKLGSLSGDKILDPFMGSGTTGVACIKNNRYFAGIEKDEKYFEIAAKRLADCASQGMLEFRQEQS